MPITTPPEVLDNYKHDPDHFTHTYAHLIAPAIERASLIPLPPSARGSDLIHAEIIRQLSDSDLVLCDMSALNANVFFELGVRTSLNLPVCLIKDRATLKIPFDTSLMNFHTYDQTLDVWTLEGEIERLSLHIRASMERSGGQNSMWKHFGLSVAAEIAQESGESDPLLKSVSRRVEEISRHIQKSATGDEESAESMLDELLTKAHLAGLNPEGAARAQTYLEIYFKAPLTDEQRQSLRKISIRINAEIISVEAGIKNVL